MAPLEKKRKALGKWEKTHIIQRPLLPCERPRVEQENDLAAVHQVVEGPPGRVAPVDVQHVGLAVLPLPLDVVVVGQEEVEAETAALVELDGLGKISLNYLNSN